MELREYQKDVLVKTWKAAVTNLNDRAKALEDETAEITLTPSDEIIDNSGVMLQMPTGSGKTVVGIFLLKLMEQQAPNAINGWLTHRAELRSQSSGRLIEAGMRVSIMNDYSPQDRVWYPGCVNVISPQLRSFPLNIKNPGMLIVDEAHHTLAKTWDKIISMWINSGGMVIGLTATPWRLSKVQHFEGHYRTLVCGPTVEWLQEHNYLATPRVITPLDALLNRDRIRVDNTGDYDQKQNSQMVMQMLSQDRAVKHWETFTENMDDCRTLWFLPDKASARLLMEKLDEPAELLLGETPQHKRDQMLAALREGEITHLVSVEVIGEGVDLPSIPIVAVLRMTKSLAVWLQQCGRGSRPKGEPGVEGGVYYIFDYAGNSHELGTPDTSHEWTLKARGKVKLGEFPYSTCYKAACMLEGTVLHPAHRTCWTCSESMYWLCTECNQTRRYNQFIKTSANLRRMKDAVFHEKCARCREVELVEKRMKHRKELEEANAIKRERLIASSGTSGFQSTTIQHKKPSSSVLDVVKPYDPDTYKSDVVSESDREVLESTLLNMIKSLSRKDQKRLADLLKESQA